jgi:CDP-6-deoxy-D-xylo-4-hexulose-3-dehydrase
MIVCKNEFDYNLLKSLRSHGWSRNTIFHNYYKKKYKELDDRFLFINSGYNLRPLDINAAIAHSQYKKLKKFIKIRSKNRELIIKMIRLFLTQKLLGHFKMELGKKLQVRQELRLNQLVL